VHEFAMQFLDHTGMVEYHFRDERPRLEISTSLTFEEVAFRADYGAVLEHRG
jgi:hypothetical protein